MTAKQTAERWGVSLRRVQFLLKDNRVPGVMRPARDWLIPTDAEKPFDARIKSGRYIKTKENTAHEQLASCQIGY